MQLKRVPVARALRRAGPSAVPMAFAQQISHATPPPSQTPLPKPASEGLLHAQLNDGCPTMVPAGWGSSIMHIPPPLHIPDPPATRSRSQLPGRP